MFGLGLSEMLLLAVLALIVIGPKQLPEVARSLGRFLNELKRSANSLTDEFKQASYIDPHLKNKKPASSQGHNEMIVEPKPKATHEESPADELLRGTPNKESSDGSKE